MHLLNRSVHRCPKAISKSKIGERSSNGELPLPKLKGSVSQATIGRKLRGIHRELASLGEQGKTKGFFNNVENSGKLGGLVEDVRDAMVDYQVCTTTDSSFLYLILCRPRYNRTHTAEVSYSSLVPPHHLSPPGSAANQRIGISGPGPSGQDVSHSGRRIFMWKGAWVSERNSEGCPVGN